MTITPPGLPPVPAGASAGRPWRRGYGGVARFVAAIQDQLADLRLNQVVLRSASLTANTTTTATITLGGVDIPGVPMLASYTPTVGDTVLVLQTRGQSLIIGRAK